MLPVIRQEVVNRHSWLGEEEFIDALAVAQSLPEQWPSTLRFRRLQGKRIAREFSRTAGSGPAFFPCYPSGGGFFVQFIENRLVAAAFAGIRPVVAALIAFAVMRLGKTVFRKIRPDFISSFFAGRI